MSDGIALRDLEVPGGEIIFDLDLYQCRRRSLAIATQNLGEKLAAGERRLARMTRLSRRVIRWAPTHLKSYEKLREWTRQRIIDAQRRDDSADEEALLFGSLWLVLHFPDRAQLIRDSILSYLEHHRPVFVQVACSAKLGYALSIYDSLQDLTPELEAALPTSDPDAAWVVQMR